MTGSTWSCNPCSSPCGLTLLATVVLVLSGSMTSLQAITDHRGALKRSFRRSMISEVGQSAYLHKTVPCNPEVMGSVEACYDQNIDAQGVVDYPFNSTAVAYPTDGRPWGVHLVGPYPDGKSYLLSWYTGGPQVGNISAPPDLTHLTSRVEVMQVGGNDHRKFSGKVISYLRSFTEESGFQDLNYLSAHINHVVLSNLLPGARYKYSLSDLNGKMVATKYHFKTLQMDRRKVYPLRIGVMGDVGQTYNSSQTRDHMRSNRPDVVFHVGDNSYADDYTALSTDYRADRTFGTNQLRWDSYHQLWQPLYAQVPILNCIGNHELEMSAISAGINYTTNHIEWPTNFPFQAYAARWPVPGTRSQFGNIDKNLYYSTVVGGVVNLIVLNNYAPFQPGSPQHMWAMKEFKAFDRAAMPWLFVIFHGPPYHTYYEHYKELDCFMSIWEDVFYDYGVDLVFGGHVHAYERSHPVYKYKPNTCAPIYVTIGDGGNIEGPYRYFVDEVNILTNKTYCAGMASLVKTFQLRYPSAWAGPGFAAYQLQAQPLVCRSMTWQPANGVGGGPVIIPYSDTSNLGFCQSSQPVWSAFRDPSFGHAIVELVSDTVVKFNWFQNYHGQMVKKDSVTLQRVLACPNKS